MFVRGRGLPPGQPGTPPGQVSNAFGRDELTPIRTGGEPTKKKDEPVLALILFSGRLNPLFAAIHLVRIQVQDAAVVA